MLGAPRTDPGGRDSHTLCAPAHNAKCGLPSYVVSGSQAVGVEEHWMNSAPHNKTARVTATRPSTEVVAPTSRSLFLDAGRDFGGSTKWCVAGAQTPNIDPEPVRGYPSIHLDTHSQRVRSGGILNERFA